MRNALIALVVIMAPAGWLLAQTSTPLYQPPGYGPGQNAEGRGFGVDGGLKKVDGDYYLTISPTFELPLLGFRLGVQVPLEFLVYDRDPSLGQKVPSLRKGMYSDKSDYARLLKYIRRGTHLFYDPDDAFNWSFFYGQMTDGYIGHRTIVNRFVSTYDPTVFRPGLMADVNNNWGGVEAFASDVWNKEVRGGRAYVRPLGIFVTGWNTFVAGDFSARDVALSVVESRRGRDDYLFQERLPEPGQGGSLRQHLYRTLKEDLEDDRVDFKETVDPVTGERKIEPVVRDANAPGDRPAGPTGPGKQPEGTGPQPLPGGPTGPTERDPKLEKAPDKDRKKSRSMEHGFLNRWAIGTTSVTDYGAPSSLEVDGSSNLVVDPYTLRPRAGTSENLTIKGVDTELRLSPFKWLELTLYGDINKIQNVDKATGRHVGMVFEFKVSTLLRWYLRPEYREITSNYLPSYFDSYYAVERTTYLPPGTTGSSTTPKLEYLRSLPADGIFHKGYYINSRLDFVSLFVLEAEYQDYAGPNNSQVMVGVFVPNISGFFMDGYYMKKNYDRIQDSFKVDDNSLMAAEAGLKFFGGLYVKYTIRRTWIYSSTTSRFEPVDESGVGFGYSATM